MSSMLKSGARNRLVILLASGAMKAGSSDRMTRAPVITTLDNAYKYTAKPRGVLIHSDRGSQYCSYDYQAYLKSHRLICSMSRKGDCWDNAPGRR